MARSWTQYQVAGIGFGRLFIPEQNSYSPRPAKSYANVRALQIPVASGAYEKQR